MTRSMVVGGGMTTADVSGAGMQAVLGGDLRIEEQAVPGGSCAAGVLVTSRPIGNLVKNEFSHV